MIIVGFEFTKIAAERKQQVTGKVNIANNVTIKNIEKSDLNLGKGKQEGIKYQFEFSSKYEPDMAIIQFEGTVMCIGEPKEIDAVLKEWKKDKRLAKEVVNLIMNTILMRCNVEAIILSRDISLPPPVPLPKVEESPKKKNEDYIG
jgi:hypothetical protein